MCKGVMDQELVSVRSSCFVAATRPRRLMTFKNAFSVMRADGVLRLLLNSKLYKGLNPTVEGKTVLMTLPNVGEKEMAIICLRVCLPHLLF